MSASSKSLREGALTQLKAGDSIASVRLREVLCAEGRIEVWRGTWPDGSAGTVHALASDATRLERELFQAAARKLTILGRRKRLRSVVQVAAVVPSNPAYVTREAAVGCMADLPILQLDLEHALVLLRRIGGSLHSLHRAGLVHGSLQPANVLLDATQEPLLGDIGTISVAQSYGRGSSREHAYLPYASPEVRRGRKATTRSDIFSFGRLLWFGTLGEVPQDEADDVPQLNQLDELPEGLVRIIRRCTVRSADDRYATIGDVLTDLSNHDNASAVGIGVAAASDAFGRAAGVRHAHSEPRARRVTPASSPPPLSGPTPGHRWSEAPPISEPRPSYTPRDLALPDEPFPAVLHHDTEPPPAFAGGVSGDTPLARSPRAGMSSPYGAGALAESRTAAQQAAEAAADRAAHQAAADRAAHQAAERVSAEVRVSERRRVRVSSLSNAVLDEVVAELAPLDDAEAEPLNLRVHGSDPMLDLKQLDEQLRQADRVNDPEASGPVPISLDEESAAAVLARAAAEADEFVEQPLPLTRTSVPPPVSGLAASDFDEPLWTPPPPAPLSDRKRDRPKRAAARSRRPSAMHPSASDGVFSFRQRVTIAVVGLLTLVLSLGFSYRYGYASSAALLGATVGVALGSVIVPHVGPALIWRVTTAFLLGAATWMLNPTAELAAWSRQHNLTQGGPQQRGERVNQMRRRGETAFHNLDLRGTDFGEMDLSHVRFDRSDLRGASFNGTLLRGVSFKGAKVTGADFSGADLSGVEIAPMNGWRNSSCSDESVLPKPWVCEDGLPNVVDERR